MALGKFVNLSKLQLPTRKMRLITVMHACMHAKLLQPCPTLRDPIDGSPPGSSVPGILQALSATPFHLKLLLISTKQQQPAIHSLNFLQVLPLCLTVLGGEYLTVSKTNPCPHGAHFLVEEVDLKQIGRFMT